MGSPSVYLLKRNGRNAYVGRGDSDVVSRMRRSHTAARYDVTVTVYRTSSARQAYLLECRLSMGTGHAITRFTLQCPAGTNWRCPIKSCWWS
jgi:hypothetical protein